MVARLCGGLTETVGSALPHVISELWWPFRWAARTISQLSSRFTVKNSPASKHRFGIQSICMFSNHWVILWERVCTHCSSGVSTRRTS